MRKGEMGLRGGGKGDNDHVMMISTSGGVQTPTKRERGSQKKPFVWETTSPRSPAAFRLLRSSHGHGHHGMGALATYRGDFGSELRRPFPRSKGCGTCFAIILGLGLAAAVGFLYLRATSPDRAIEPIDSGDPRRIQELIWGGMRWWGDSQEVTKKWAMGVDQGFDLRKWTQTSDQETVQSERSLWEDAHAVFRNRTGGRAELVPLQWDDDIKEFAERHVNMVRKEKQCRLEPSKSNPKYGENLYWAAYEMGPEEDPFMPISVVEEWFNTGNVYDYTTNSCPKKKDCAPYCQILWHKTRRFGCASAECPYDGAFEGRQQIFACYYHPPMEKGACTHSSNAQRPF